MSNRQSLIDEESALSALCGDRKLLQELATMFVEDAPTLLDELEKAIERRDIETARRTIHSLRGLSSTFYANEVINFALRLEHELNSDRVDLLQSTGLGRLRCSVDGLIQELRNAGYIE